MCEVDGQVKVQRRIDISRQRQIHGYSVDPHVAFYWIPDVQARTDSTETSVAPRFLQCFALASSFTTTTFPASSLIATSNPQPTPQSTNTKPHSIWLVNDQPAELPLVPPRPAALPSETLPTSNSPGPPRTPPLPRPPPRPPQPAAACSETSPAQPRKLPYPHPHLLYRETDFTSSGVAIGSSVGHAISGFFGGSSANEPLPAEQAAQNNSVQANGANANGQSWGNNCAGATQNFTKCMDEQGGNMQICGWYLEQLKACQAAASQY